MADTYTQIYVHDGAFFVGNYILQRYRAYGAVEHVERKQASIFIAP